MNISPSQKYTLRAWIAGPFALLLAATAGLGQQKVPFQNNIPVAPRGLEKRRLPEKPMEFDTAEGQRIRVVVVTRALEYPWSLAFLPDGSMLVTERAGRLRILRNGVLDPKPIAGAPAAYFAGESGFPGAVHGFMDIALHPRFAENSLVYLTYTKPLDEKRRTTALARGRWDGHALTDMHDIFVLDQAGTSRIAFGKDGTLFMTTTGNNPQDPNTQGGKVLRLNDDGSIPKDNPFAGRSGYKPEVYTLGHRSSLGLAMHPGTGEMSENENGPNGGDEINILRPGKNYGCRVRKSLEEEELLTR
jgi:glucose/arabinose dehydrogenase